MDRVTKFAEQVVEKKLDRLIGKTETLSAQRHLNDLERAGTDEFPYVFDEKKAQHIIDFAETLTLAEGIPSPLRLWGFQDFVFGSWNGWIHKDTGFRRFRTSYKQVGRQNGKSIGNAIPSIYYGNFTPYQYPQVYCTATKKQQAKIVLSECYKFINADIELSGTSLEKGLFTIKDYNSIIECNLTNGYIMALGRDTDTIDGFRPYFGSVDEYHKHKTNQMYKLLVDGMNEMDEGLISVITTAGFDLKSPCYELYEYSKNVLRGIFKNETHFVYITELDKEDDLWNEDNWGKANPLWTATKRKNIKTAAETARDMQGEELRNFLTKSLNKWVSFSENDYINLDNWKKCETNMTLEDMRGKECIVGLDLSSGGDLTSVVFEFPLADDKYFIESHSFIPAKRVEEHIKTDNVPYDMWIAKELLTATETLGGIKTDYKYIVRYMRQIRDDFGIKFRAIAYDPHNASAFLSDLEELGVDCIEIVQSARSLNDATVDFSLEVDAGNMLHNPQNELLSWSAANAKTTSNSFGEIKIDKDFRTKRIDPIDAAICAHKVAMSVETTKVSKYATEEFLTKLWGG